MTSSKLKHITAEKSLPKLVDEMRAAGTLLERVPTQHDMGRVTNGVACNATFKRKFGSWSTALQVAGYPPEQHRQLRGVRQLHRIAQYLIDNHETIGELLQQDFRHESTLPSRDTINKLFGTAENAFYLANLCVEELGVCSKQATAAKLVKTNDAKRLQEFLQANSTQVQRRLIADEDYIVKFYDHAVADTDRLVIARDIWTYAVAKGEEVRNLSTDPSLPVFRFPHFVARIDDDELCINGPAYRRNQTVEDLLA